MADDTTVTAEAQLLSKVKDVVSETMETKLAEMQSAKIFDGAVADGDVTTEIAQKFMTPTFKHMEAKLTSNEVKKFHEDVVIFSFLKALRNNDMATVQTISDMAAVKDLSEGTNSAGGYLVPSVLSNRIYEIILAQGIARREMTVVPMTSKTMDLSTLATRPTIYYVAEGAAITQSDPAFGRKTLTTQKMAGITAMSNEVFEDANINLVPYIIQKFAEAFTHEEDKAFFNTSSSGGITGILEDTGVNIVTMASTKTAFSDVSYANLVDVIYSLDVSQRAGAQWCMSSDILAYISKLVDDNNNPLWMMTREGQPSRLLGYPVIENDQMPGTADSAVSTSFIAFGNYKNYIIGDRRAVDAKVLKEGTVGSTNLAEKDSTGVVITQRVCGIAPTPLSFAKLRTAAS